MSHDPPMRVAVVGDGPAAAAYAAISPVDGIALFRATLEDGLANQDVGGVIVASPVTERPDAALAAIAAGKPVLVEAPMAGSVADADRVSEAAAGAQVPVSTTRPWRRLDVFQSFRATVDAGELGPPAFFHWVSEDPSTGPEDDNPAAVTTAGLDLALWFLADAPVRVFARRTGLGGVTVSLRFRGGANALIERRGVAPSHARGAGFAWLLGPRGEVRWDERRAGVEVRSDASPASMISPGCLAAEVAAAVAGWRDRSAPGPDPAERALVATLAAVNASIQLGQPVMVETGEEENGSTGNE